MLYQQMGQMRRSASGGTGDGGGGGGGTTGSGSVIRSGGVTGSVTGTGGSSTGNGGSADRKTTYQPPMNSDTSLLESPSLLEIESKYL